jgi:hypothetical protein
MIPFSELPSVKRFNKLNRAKGTPVASDYNTAGIITGHNLYVLRSVTEDLIKGFFSDANQRRHISTSKADIATAVAALAEMLDEIERADTASRGTVPSYIISVFP